MTGDSRSATRRRGRPPAGGREAILAAALRILRERGIARVTAREVAAMARVSEASVFYHYKDRAGLLQAVFEQGVAPLRDLAAGGGLTGADVHEVLMRLGTALEQFLDQALPVMAAAQSDIALRDAMAAYMTEEDLGPHRGVRGLAGYLAGEQAAGRVRADVDPHAVAMMFVGACYTRAAQRQMPAHAAELPALEDVIRATEDLLAPVGPQGGPLGPQGGPLGPQGGPLGPQGGLLGPQGGPLGPQGGPGARRLPPTS